jgi:hypothetical protein
MLTSLTALGLVAVLSGAILIIRALVSARIPVESASNPQAGSSDLRSFAIQDDRRINASFGISVAVIGAILLLLHFTELVLSPAAFAILAFLTIIFMTSYRLYSQHQRASQSERFQTWLAARGEAGTDAAAPEIKSHGTS